MRRITEREREREFAANKTANIMIGPVEKYSVSMREKRNTQTGVDKSLQLNAL